MPRRRILKQAAVQLRDAHGNAVALAGVKLKWKLAICSSPAAGGGEGGGGAAAAAGEPPELECDGGALRAETDERGRAFFGDVFVKAGTGRVVRLNVVCARSELHSFWQCVGESWHRERGVSRRECCVLLGLAAHT